MLLLDPTADICETPVSPARFAFSSNSNEWYTPTHILQFARWFLGSIELDPASCAEANERVQAERYFGLDNGLDGLTEPWNASTVFCNPPYGRGGQDAFVTKMLREYALEHFESGLLLVNACTSEHWFAPLYDYPICFIRGRLKFQKKLDLLNTKATGSTKGSALIYIGNNPTKAFADACSAHNLGRVMLSISPAVS